MTALHLQVKILVNFLAKKKKIPYCVAVGLTNTYVWYR